MIVFLSSCGQINSEINKKKKNTDIGMSFVVRFFFFLHFFLEKLLGFHSPKKCFEIKTTSQ